MRQGILFYEKKASVEHGGSLLTGKQKDKRPMIISKPLHLVLKSDVAVGNLSLTRHEQMIEKTLRIYAEMFQVKVYKCSINRTHIHLCVKGTDRKGLESFFKVFAGVTAKKILFISKSEQKKLWTYRIFSRVVEWGRAFKAVIAYIRQNELETRGEVPYSPRIRKKKKETCIDSSKNSVNSDYRC